MSVSGGSQEMRRATINATAPASDDTIDLGRAMAKEERKLHRVMWTADANVKIEVSFSSAEETITAPSGSFEANDSRSSVIISVAGGAGGQGHKQPEDLNIDWDAGEEVHLHVGNGNVDPAAVIITLFYTEV